MFTGIVEGVGVVKSLQEQEESWLLELDLPFADGRWAGCRVTALRSMDAALPLKRMGQLMVRLICLRKL